MDNDLPFTVSEIDNVISNLKNKKAPGHDSLNAEIIKETFRLSPHIFHNLSNLCLNSGRFPTMWKTAICRLIPKPGTQEINQPRHYRPISLLPVLGKTLEKLLIDRINHHLYKNNYLHKNQFGFTPQTSTIDAVLLVKHLLNTTLYKKQICLVISLDISSAFDHAWIPKILYQLRRHKCPQNLYYLTKHYFSNRKVILNYKGNDIIRNVEIGYPQGSSCGPGFWNILMNSVFEIPLPQSCNLICFADDCLVTIRAKTIHEIERDARIVLSKLSHWGETCKLKFNPLKSQLMLVTRKLKIQKPLLIFQGEPLNYVHENKYLGCIIDKNLSWVPHIRYALGRAERLLHMFNRVATLHWGLSPNTIDTIYEGAVLPRLLYACRIWGEAATIVKIKELLLKFQRRICIKIIKGYRTISRHSALLLANILPLDLLIQETIDLYNSKKNGKFTVNSTTFSADTAADFRLLPHPSYNNDTHIIQYNETHNIMIFTDGSCSDNGVGSAFCVLLGNQVLQCSSFKLHPHCTITQAEAWAMKQALIYINSNKIENALVCTDSKTIIQYLKKPKITSKFYFSMYNLFQNCVLQFNTTVCWIRGHSGCRGNELADLLACTAHLNETISFSLLSPQFIKNHLRNTLLEAWNERWINDNKGKITHQFFPTIYNRTNIKTAFLSAETTQFLTGHGRFNSYLYRFKILTDDNCNCNATGTPDTIEHIIYDCPLFNPWRKRLISFFQNQLISWPVKLNNLVDNTNILNLTITCFKQCSKFYGPISTVNNTTNT